MTLTELIAAFRLIADDATLPYLWADTEITRYANESERDAVERGLLIEDDNHGSAIVTTTVAGVTGTTAEVQTVTVTGTAGTFALSYGGQKTTEMAYNVSAVAMQSALEALSTVTPGDVSVGLSSGVYTLTWAVALGDVEEVVADDTFLLNTCVDVAIIPGKHTYTLDSRVLKITRARTALRDRHLILTDKDSLDRGSVLRHHGYGRMYRHDRWELEKGIPYCLIENTGGVRLVGIPTEADTLRLTVKRLPLVDMSGSGLPEIRAERHFDLLDGMLARAYLKNDTDTQNKVKAEEYETRFTRNFGPKIDASVRTKQRTPRSNTTRINW